MILLTWDRGALHPTLVKYSPEPAQVWGGGTVCTGGIPAQVQGRGCTGSGSRLRRSVESDDQSIASDGIVGIFETETTHVCVLRQ